MVLLMSKKKKKKKKFNNYNYNFKSVNSADIDKVAFYVFGSLYYSQQPKETDIIDS